MDSKRILQSMEDNHIPMLCEECQGVMVFQGVGEYQCEICGRMDYDDYGKVRNYVEGHPGATTVDVEKETGVSQKTIMRMLREGRFMVTDDRKLKLFCNVCGRSIRSGSLCEVCERNAHRLIEEEQRNARRKYVKGYGMYSAIGDGLKRYTRGDN